MSLAKMIKIIFFGTPDIGVKSLEYLCNSQNIEVLAVVTQPDKPAGRGHKLQASPIKKLALEKGLPVFQPKSIRKEPEIIEELKKLEPDFFVTFAFGQILSQEVLDIPKYETINLHASLLPRYRGANPIQRAIINGDKETGICTMITELGLDCGDICQKLVIPISETMNCGELWEEIAQKSPKMIEETLIGLKNQTLCPEKQCEDGVCMANKLTKEECLIDWNKSNQQIHNLVRGVCRCPSAYFID
jgi:methionyl-tRNA formyltransferase